MSIPKKPNTAKVDDFISRAKASKADTGQDSPEDKKRISMRVTPEVIRKAKGRNKAKGPKASTEKKAMFSVRLTPGMVKKIKVWASLQGKTKEGVAQEAFEDFFKDKDVPV